jgi:hypothetical protein
LRAGILACGLALLVAGFASAAEGHGEASPTGASPGGDIELVFVLPAQPIDVEVASSYSCVIVSDATSERTSCGDGSSLVVAQVSGSESSYAFHVRAPQAPGSYHAEFTRTALVDIPMGNDHAEATFVVSSASTSTPGGQPLDSNGLPTSGGGGGGAGGGVNGALGSDVARWLVSSMLGGAAIFACVATGRGERP